LSGLLHYILNECDQPLVPLEKEMKMIQDYVSLEKIRYGKEMNMSVELPDNCSNKMIAPLLLIPFIENSFKHGASKMLTHPYVKLRIAIEGDMLHFELSNSRPQVHDLGMVRGNIGLKNVTKRLELLYPADHALDITVQKESFAVDLKIRLVDMADTTNTREIRKPVKEYAMG
ncbi:MAG TPA: histidine kinase, partial [Chitinophagaceae bacterium]|nr:histidine kinase [Chitinophagaceae bacterium]